MEFNAPLMPPDVPPEDMPENPKLRSRAKNAAFAGQLSIDSHM